MPYEIKNIFVTINDDKQKLSRSSLARGTKFDNSLVEGYMLKAKEREKKGGESVIKGSVRMEEVNDYWFFVYVSFVLYMIFKKCT